MHTIQTTHLPETHTSHKHTPDTHDILAIYTHTLCTHTTHRPLTHMSYTPINTAHTTETTNTHMYHAPITRTTHMHTCHIHTYTLHAHHTHKDTQHTNTPQTHIPHAHMCYGSWSSLYFWGDILTQGWRLSPHRVLQENSVFGADTLPKLIPVAYFHGSFGPESSLTHDF